jgi:polyphosphate kinase
LTQDPPGATIVAMSKSPAQLVARPPEAARFFNRELSWMAFNARVLAQAQDARVPLLERLRFLTIFHTNFDEFFMIRVSALKQQLAAKVSVKSADGLTPRQALDEIGDRLPALLDLAQKVLHDDLLPALAAEDISIVRYPDLSPAEQLKWDHWVEESVHPVLTPLAVGPTHPFPFISNLSLNLATFVRDGKGEERFARVKVPARLPRLVPISTAGRSRRFLLLEELIAANLHILFPGATIDRPWQFRVTRDADVEIREDEANDLLKTVEEGVRQRRFGDAVRLEVQRGCPEAIRTALQDGLEVTDDDTYEVDGLLAVWRLSALLDCDRPNLKYPTFIARTSPGLGGHDVFADVRAGDVLLHHPFESFAPVVDFVRAAATDPKVQAIKQTLYRTSGDSPVVGALETAIDNDKQVAAVVELKARFDEQNNIGWARRLEESGVHVVYGVTGLKTHAKMTLVVREEDGVLRRYAHIGTGNYNPSTARVYTDIGVLTADPDVTRDVADLFNRMTGFGKPPRYRSLLVAPDHLRKELLKRIKREAKHAKNGQKAYLIFKCNAITDEEIITALYDANRAGVRIDLLVRGVCCLVPGVAGQSERIRVKSAIGRYLEHSRAYWFENAGDPEIYVGSADLMGRNLDRRVEILMPIRDPEAKRWLREVFLQRYLDDDGRSWDLGPDGEYRRVTDGAPKLDVHDAFMADKKR